MIKYYTLYSRHCLRYYANNPNPRPTDTISELNWLASKQALASFPEDQRLILMEVYQRCDTMPDNIYEVSMKHNMARDTIWAWVRDLEKQVAQNRGLI